MTELTATATINGVSSDSVSVISETEAVASFGTYGIPATTEVPDLHFTHSDGYDLYASIDAAASFEKVIDVTSSSSSLECSFAGGCSYAIESDGLFGTLLDNNNEIRICGSTCELVDDLSSASFAVCNLP
jgi:hypothetical protein